MESLYILIPIAIAFVAIAIAIFLWAVKSDQFDDLERHGHNVLFDDDVSNKKSKKKTKGTSKISNHND